MLQLEQSISVKADKHVVWAFLTDISNSMCFNRFHKDLKEMEKYSISPGSEFFVCHNFGISDIRMLAKVISCQPLSNFSIKESPVKKDQKGLQHTVTFRLEQSGNKTKIIYLFEGTFGNNLKDIPFRPIMKGVMVEELLRMKHAIESSESTNIPLKSSGFKPV